MSADSEVKNKHIFMWKIKDFKLCAKKKGECVESLVFRAKNLWDTAWCMKLYPRGDVDSKQGYVGCFLERCEDDGASEIKSEFEISIMSAEGIILQSNKTSRVFRKGDFFGWRDFWKKSVQCDESNDALLLRCILQSNSQENPLNTESSVVTSFDYNQRSCKLSLKFDCTEVQGQRFQYTSDFYIIFIAQVHHDEIKFKIRKQEVDVEAKAVICEISLLDLKGRKQVSKQDFYFFETEDPLRDIWEFPIFLKKSILDYEKEKYLKDNCFTLKIEIKISNGAQTDSVEENKRDSSGVELSHSGMSTKVLLDDCKRLYRDKIHSDVKLLVGGQVIPAHKNILSIRSPVFLAMFDTDMVENETGSVAVRDLDAETMHCLLEYMYTGTVEKLDHEIAMKLIVAADKYQVLHLKEVCAKFLQYHLSVENVCDVLVVADMIQHEVVKDSCICFIKDNLESVFLSDEWKSVAQKNVQLTTDSLINVSKLMATNPKQPGNKSFSK